jgi:hypothetical protein
MKRNDKGRERRKRNEQERHGKERRKRNEKE